MQMQVVQVASCKLCKLPFREGLKNGIFYGICHLPFDTIELTFLIEIAAFSKCKVRRHPHVSQTDKISSEQLRKVEKTNRLVTTE